MNKTKIQKFAVEGHKLLYSQISQRAYQFGVEEADPGKPDATEVRGRVLSPLERSQRASLIEAINENGYPQTIEKITYIWFNRIVALRFMEINNYLPSHIRIFSDANGDFKPEVLKDVLHLEIDGLDKDQIADYLENNQTDELYRYILLTQCAELQAALPDIFVFSIRERDYTELLFPNNILSNDSFIGKMLSETDEKEDWQDAVQIIGWLYQYYNDERKNEVINIYKGTVKKEDIPAATQLFTTDWVVRYMVDNSLGRFWIERHPESNLSDKLAFLATPKGGKIEYINDPIKPEEVKFLDPCMGSGHILVYAFDVLIEIYKECGYSERDAAKLIVQNNLFGLDIDDRASQLAYFAVMMKARSYDRRFLNRGIKPNVFAIKESNKIGTVVREGLSPDAKMNAISQYLVKVFKDAKELGSIITVERKDYDGYLSYLEKCEGKGQLSLEDSKWLTETRKMLKGLAFQAKVLSSKYPIVCTNPPYLNKIESNLKTFVTEFYKDYSGDLFSVFMYRNLQFCNRDGYCAFMTPFVWMFIKTYENLREYIIQNKHITSLIQMEYSAFEEATVPICSFVLANNSKLKSGLYFRLSDFKGGMEIQREKVLEAISNHNCGYFYESDQTNFTKIPGTPIAYWASEKIFSAFADGEVLKRKGDTRQGMATSDNNRFLRLWHEISYTKLGLNCKDADSAQAAHKKWYPYNKGGEFRKWYGNIDYTVNYENDGFEVKQYAASLYKTPTRTIKSMSEYFKPCLSWSKISSGSIAFRYYPEGFVFDVAGCCIFYKDISRMLYDFGFLNSIVAKSILAIISPTLNYEAGHIASLPVIYNASRISEVERIVKQNIELGKADWDSFETSWDFEMHPIVKKALSRSHWGSDSAITIEYVYKYVTQDFEDRFLMLKANEEELNRIFTDIYSLQDELTPEVEDREVTVRRADLGRDIRSMISYAVGCMFGRYSLAQWGLSYAGGEWNPGGRGLADYGEFEPDKDNIIPICDDEYFDDDITGRFVKWVEVVFGKETLEENLKYIADAIGGKGTPREVIRNYFLNDFYADHLKTYQKRPIYWLFDSGKKNGFKALIYMHRYQSDLLARMRTDYVHEQQERYRTQLKHIGDAMDSASASERVKLAKQQKKLQEQALELQKYEEKIHHLADQNIKIDLDDGVKHNYALFEDVLAKIK